MVGVLIFAGPEDTLYLGKASQTSQILLASFSSPTFAGTIGQKLFAELSETTRSNLAANRQAIDYRSGTVNDTDINLIKNR